MGTTAKAHAIVGSTPPGRRHETDDPAVATIDHQATVLAAPIEHGDHVDVTALTRDSERREAVLAQDRVDLVRRQHRRSVAIVRSITTSRRVALVRGVTAIRRVAAIPAVTIIALLRRPPLR